MDLGIADVHTPGATGGSSAQPLEDPAEVVRRVTADRMGAPAAAPLTDAAAKRKARIDARKKRALGAPSVAPAPAPTDRRKRIPKTIHIRADLAPGGALHVRHMANGEATVYLPAVLLTDTD